MAQELLSQLEITPSQANWNSSMNSNIASLQAYIKTYVMSIYVQGSHSTPSQIRIQLEDAKGTPVSETAFLRVRICNQDGYSNATNATIAVAGGTSAVDVKTGSKDMILKSNSTGLFELTLTDGTAETVTLRIGPAEFSPHFGNHHNSLNITHT